MKKDYHVVAMGGGNGATRILQAVQGFAVQRTAIIAITDTGRSTGLARAMGNIPAPGDLRATIAGFANNQLFAELLQYRFNGDVVPQLEGMAFGNLLITALAGLTQDFAAAVEQIALWADCTLQVLPISTANAHLCAELIDGTIVKGELAVRGLNKSPINRIFLCDESPANPQVLSAIREADLITIGPGSLFTSVLVNLLFNGVIEALRETEGKVVYVCNNTTQSGQTDGYTAFDHVRHLVELVGPNVIDVALINRSDVASREALRQYEADNLFLLQPSDDEITEITKLGVRVMARELIEPIGQERKGQEMWNKQDTIRHDEKKLSLALEQILA